MVNNQLFSPLEIRSVSIRNRIVISPMCQYSAVNGNANDWHLAHYMNMAISGAGMYVLESTAISERGRISYGDLGLYSDCNEKYLTKMVKSCKKFSKTPIACQLSHSGRKGSVAFPWDGGRHLTDAQGAWPTVSASTIPRYEGASVPTELDSIQLNQIKTDFKSATQRAINAEIDVVELHVAHGYLLHQFYSPVSNHRTDEYGGNLGNRMKFILEVVESVRSICPPDMPVGVRVTAQDWLDNGSTMSDCITLVHELKRLGVDYVCVSSGGILPVTNLKSGIGYQVKFASEIKKNTGILTRAVGEINDYRLAQKIIEAGDADLIAIGRSYLNDPRWVWRAAIGLGEKVVVSHQYERGYW